jgi:hypothetical protein
MGHEDGGIEKGGCGVGWNFFPKNNMYEWDKGEDMNPME